MSGHPRSPGSTADVASHSSTKMPSRNLPQFAGPFVASIIFVLMSMHRNSPGHRQQFTFPIAAPEANQRDVVAVPVDVQNLAMLVIARRPYVEHEAARKDSVRQTNRQIRCRIVRRVWFEHDHLVLSV